MFEGFEKLPILSFLSAGRNLKQDKDASSLVLLEMTFP